jgi:integrase
VTGRLLRLRWRHARCRRPSAIDNRRAVEEVDGLPDGFRFHDLRHYFASVLIAGGCDVKAVQAAMRHGTASMTLDVYAGLWPDADDRARSAVSAALAKRRETAADGLRTTTRQAVR